MDTIDFSCMRSAGALARETLEMIAQHVQPGATTNALNTLCHDFIVDHGAVPAPLNYKGYPKSICTSVNHVVCHGIPNDRPLQEGQIVNVDVTVYLNGHYGDTSRMFAVGAISKGAQKLLDVTHEALILGLRAARDHARLGDIGHAIQTFVESHRFSVVRDYCGHGIGREFHTSPSVLHYGEPNTGTHLKPGDCITIEPMVNMGKPDTKVLPDDWTVVTRDRSLSAQYEHTLGFTENGIDIFTMSQSDKTLFGFST